MFIAALFTIASYGKKPRGPTIDEWIKKMWSIYTMEFYSVLRNNDIWFEGKWMQLEDSMLSEVSQAQKYKGLNVVSHIWKIEAKDKHIHKTSMIIYNSNLERVYNSGTTL
jgi:hypothetical protein